MADFPATIYNQRTIENLPGIIYDADNTKTLFAEDFRFIGDEVNAIESTLGANPQGGEDTVGGRIAAVESALADIPGLISSAIAAVYQVIYAVGKLYTSYDVSTSPADILGFGTWVALESRVLVGRSSAGTFNVAGGTTGGAETHTLTTAEMPAHTHGVGLDPGNRFPAVANGNNPISRVYGSDNYFTTSTGSDGAHNNLQPYIVVYMWKRTA